jgi:hypothetical protein
MNDRLLKRLILKEIRAVLRESDEKYMQPVSKETMKELLAILKKASNAITPAIELEGIQNNMKVKGDVMELQGRIETFIENNSDESFNDDDDEDPYDGMYDPDDQ